MSNDHWEDHGFTKENRLINNIKYIQYLQMFQIIPCDNEHTEEINCSQG